MKNTRLYIVHFFAVLAVLLSSCGDDSSSPEEEKPDPSFDNAELVIDAYASETFELKITNFDDRVYFKVGDKTISYDVKSQNAESATLTLTVPTGIESGRIMMYVFENSTFVQQGPQLNYLKQYAFLNLRWNTFGKGMCGLTDNSVILWNPLQSRFETVSFKEFLTTPSASGANFTVTRKSEAVTVADNSRRSTHEWYFAGIAKNASGEVFYAQYYNTPTESKILAKMSNAAILTTFPVLFTWIHDLEIDSEENAYTVEKDVYAIKKGIPGGAAVVLAGSTTTPGHVDATGAAARFTDIRAIAMDANDNLYVADGNCIRKVTPAGVVSTIAGSVTAGDVDGAALDARFEKLMGISVTADGTVYVIDGGNEKVKALKDGKVITLKGIEITPAASEFALPLFVDANHTVYINNDRNNYLHIFMREDHLPSNNFTKTYDGDVVEE
jgi:hypothetical protein